MMHTRGFSMVELVVVLGIIGVLAAASVSTYGLFRQKNELIVATNTLTQALRYTQALARGGVYDDDWSVQLEQGAITVFKGLIYSSRDTQYDELIELPPVVLISGDTLVQYNQQTGLPVGTATTVLTIGTTTETIEVNQYGAIQF